MNYDVILFDLDGTLTDSAPGIINCVKYALEKLNLEIPTDKVLKAFVGPSLDYSFKHFCGLDDTLSDKAITLYRERYAQKGLFENRLFDGIYECLSALYENGATLCIASSKPTVFVTKILEEFEIADFFEVVVGTELDKKDMTKADVINLALNLAGDSNAVMVGDRYFDSIGAKDNNLDFIGVTYGYGGYEELCDYDSVALVDTPEELLEFLSF